MMTVAIVAVLAACLVVALVLAVRRWGITGPPRITVDQGAFVNLAKRVLPEAPVATSQIAALGRVRDSGWSGSEPTGRGRGSVGRGPRRGDVLEAAALVGGAEALTAQSWLTTDPHVFDAFSQLSHEQIHGFWDLENVVDAHHYNIASDAFQRAMAGHTAEFHVADHFHQAGLHTVMPGAANEPGLDLWVEGHPLNVKNVQNVSTTAHEHFANYPGIPIIVPSDAQHIPAAAVNFDPGQHIDPAALVGDHHVIVDGALLNADMAGNMDHAAGLVQNHGVPDHAFPVATLIVSGFREVKLLRSKDTILGRALKNVGLDVAGGGVGAHYGAAAGVAGAAAAAPHLAGMGAAAGAIAGPPGMAAGALIGAVIGGLGGRYGAKRLRNRPLTRAQENMRAAAGYYDSREKEVAADAERDWAKTVRSTKGTFHRRLRALEKKNAEVISELQGRIEGSTRLSAEDASRLLAAADGRLQRLLEELEAADSVDARQNLRADYQRWQEQVTELMKSWNETPRDTEMLFDLLLAIPGYEPIAVDYLQRIAALHALVYEALADAAKRLTASSVSLRTQAVESLQQKWDEVAEMVDAALTPAAERLKSVAAVFEQELRRAGVAPA